MPRAALTKPQIKALEQLFVAQLPKELGGDALGLGLVQRIPKRIAEQLIEKGFCERVDRKLPANRHGPSVTISGYEITLAGHMAYCFWASENCSNEELAAEAREDAELLREK